MATKRGGDVHAAGRPIPVRSVRQSPLVHSAALLAGTATAPSDVVMTTSLVRRSKIWYSPGQKERSCSTRDLAMLKFAALSSQNKAFSLSFLTISYRTISFRWLASSSFTITAHIVWLLNLLPECLWLASMQIRVVASRILHGIVRAASAGSCDTCVGVEPSSTFLAVDSILARRFPRTVLQPCLPG